MVPIAPKEHELMSEEVEIRTYKKRACAIFRKTAEEFGGLSNMAPGYPLRVNGAFIRTSEALYQACRFPDLPTVQRLIIDQGSPMTAKMKSKPFRHQSRPDWEQKRVAIMRWCLRIKLAQNFKKFAELLLKTGDKPIVEHSKRDDFWGAKEFNEEMLKGRNVLGRLLMELREIVKKGDQGSLFLIPPLDISDFLLYDEHLATIEIHANPQLIEDVLKTASNARPLRTAIPIQMSM